MKSNEKKPETVSDPNEEKSTPEETRVDLLTRSKRSAAPILKDFVQNPDGNLKDRSGPLSEFVKNGDLRGLRAFLLLHAIISSGGENEDWSTSLPIGAWSRAFDTTIGAEPASARAAVSKIFRRLQDRNLITRTSTGKNRLVKVTILRPDGHGGTYTRPGNKNTDRFLKLDYKFWTEKLYEQLDISATAMLLVALHEKPGFELPTENVPKWYGWSADTAERGFKKLEALDLLKIDKRTRKAPLTDSGLTTVNVYTLIGAFAHEEAAEAK
ncbi:hypothetical protein OIU93_19985 [Paeniglutamicibacter sp. ZC-3]|uniref:hypothetical protein n=1 Tax=Paeniglutamicibacter sp. ZC-3 TaxID=2986919 RepID=UPI0021F76CFC|nr:hypothetical protein [Paeniglutamicibacter sp. ZC-3]MCV9996548.1 hypothetical protein [Paeniglutamicibacter sp. ZC-3]